MGLTVMEFAVSNDAPFASVTEILNVNVPAVVDVPFSVTVPAPATMARFAAVSDVPPELTSDTVTAI